jgi:SAM-dependent methyltransferase
MPYFFKPGRYLLRKKIKEAEKYIHGVLLDIGSGGKDYRNLVTGYSEYKTLEHDNKFKPDIMASVYGIPIPDNSFDTIISTQVLEHLEFPEQAVKEIFRVLKRGGHCLISAPMLNELHEEPFDFFRYTSYGLEKLANRAGFEIVSINRVGGYHCSRAQLAIKYLWLRWQNNKYLLRPFILFSKIYGRIMIWLDEIDKSEANQKFAFIWFIVLKKP